MATVYKLNREPSARPARPIRARAAAPARKTQHGELSAEQKAKICQIANKAAERQGVTHWRDKIEFRRRVQREQFGLTSLTAATQAQYADIKAAFESLAGDDARAYTTIRRGQDNPRRVALWNLQRACAAAKLSTAYAQSICKTQYRCTLDEANEKQLWRLVYTIKNRAKSRQRKADTQGADCPF